MVDERMNPFQGKIAADPEINRSIHERCESMPKPHAAVGVVETIGSSTYEASMRQVQIGVFVIHIFSVQSWADCD